RRSEAGHRERGRRRPLFGLSQADRPQDGGDQGEVRMRFRRLQDRPQGRSRDPQGVSGEGEREMITAKRARVAAAALLALALAASAKRDVSPSTASGLAPLAVDAGTLWDPNAAQDPVVTYRLRIDAEPANPALHNNLGNLYVMRNWMEEAVVEYKKAIDLDPKNATAWNNLGSAYHKMGKKSSALSAFRHATDISPRYALAWYNIGTVLDEDGDY